MSERVTTAYEAKTPTQLAEEISRADSVKLRFDNEVYPLTKTEIGWLVAALGTAEMTERPTNFKECEYPNCKCVRHGRCGNAADTSTTPSPDLKASQPGREAMARIIDPDAMSLAHKLGRPDAVLTAEMQARIHSALAKADAILSLTKGTEPGAVTEREEVVWLREVDAGTDNACWVISNRVDPAAVPFFAGVAPR